MMDKKYIEQVNQMYPDLKDTDIIEECAILEGGKGEQQLTISREIDKNKLCNYSEKIGDIKENFTRVKQMFEMLSADIDDYLNLLNNNLKLNVKDESKEVIRSMVHLLSSAKLFIEYSIVQCKKYSNKYFNLEEKFKQVNSAQFDNVFSHRFCLYLRNFTQHVGLPISCVKESIENGVWEKQYLIEIDYLLNSSFNWKKLEKELIEKREINKYIDARKIVEDYYQSLVTLYFYFNQILFERFQAELEEIKLELKNLGIKGKRYGLYRVSKGDLKNKKADGKFIHLYSINSIDEIYLEMEKFGFVKIVNNK